MTQGFLAVDASGGSPTYSAGTYRLAHSGIYVSNAPLTVRGGALSIDSFAASLSGTTVNIGPGRGVVQGVTTSTQGAYPFYSTTTLTQALNAASAQDRIDLIYWRLQDNEVDSSGATQVIPVYLPGTPSGSPVAPTIPGGQAGFNICTVLVPHTGSPALTQAGVMPYTAAAGAIVPALSVGQPGSPETGQVRWRADRAPTVQPGPLEIWDGSAWDAVVPDSYPRGQLGAAKLTSAASNSGNSTPIVDVTKTVTLTSGRRYRAHTFGTAFGNQTSGQNITIALYYISGTSMPANAVGATLMLAQPYYTGSGVPFMQSEEMVAPSSGSFTFCEAYWLSTGTGVVLPNNTRSLRIEDVGI
jgi:hypothetical protein